MSKFSQFVVALGSLTTDFVVRHFGHRASQDLKQELYLIRNNLAEIIRLQQAEDATADPANFEKTVLAFKRTALFEGTQPPESPEQGQDGEIEIEDCLDAMGELIGFQLPENPVYEYPFKTVAGQQLEHHRKRLISQCYYLGDYLYTTLDCWITRKFFKGWITNIEEAFPDVLVGENEDDPITGRHFFVKLVHANLKLHLTVVPILIQFRREGFIKKCRDKWGKYKMRKFTAIITAAAKEAKKR